MPIVLRVKDSDGRSSRAGRHHAPTTLIIKNESQCTFKRLICEATQIDGWDAFPEEIPPETTIEVVIKFETNWKVDVDKDHGECSYQAFSPDEQPLTEVTISADASGSSGLVGTFYADIEVRWGNLPNVFGVSVSPVDGQLGFKHKGTVEMKIEGKPLRSGERVETAEGKVSEWMPAEKLDPQLAIGDIVAADRGFIFHYGIAYRKDADAGKTVLAHLNGTAEDVLDKFKMGSGREVLKAVRMHGGIAVVAETKVEDFANGDNVRVHNAYDYKLKPFSPEVIAERIKSTMGHRDYSLREFNCEHYAHLMRYGLTYSGQIEELMRLNERFRLKVKNFRGEEFLHDTIAGRFSVQTLQDGIERLRAKHFATPEPDDEDEDEQKEENGDGDHPAESPAT